MTSTLTVPIEVIAVVHPIDGGGYWAEVPCFPGCIAQAETLETLGGSIRLAIADWLTASPMKSAEDARQLAAIQGGGVPADETFPNPTSTHPHRHGRARMSRAGPAQFPIRWADILFAQVPDPNGQNPKIRRVVVLTPDTAIAAGYPLVVVAVTGTLPDPLTADYVRLPYKNPPGRHPKTGLTKEAAVLCTWIALIALQDIHGRSGFVPPAVMAIVHSKTEATAKAIGGWP